MTVDAQGEQVTETVRLTEVISVPVDQQEAFLAGLLACVQAVGGTLLGGSSDVVKPSVCWWFLHRWVHEEDYASSSQIIRCTRCGVRQLKVFI